MKTNLKTLITAALALTVFAASVPSFAAPAKRHATSSASTSHYYANPDREWGGPNSQMND